jgi:hypothetical protein
MQMRCANATPLHAKEGGSIMKKLAIIIAATCLFASAETFAAARAGGTQTAAKQTTAMRTHQTPTTTTASTVHGPAMTGQPKQSCGSATAPNTPGKSASAPGSAFNPNGNAGTHYAGQQPQNSRNTASVSQYDSACAHQH